jgi:molybdopterin-guanine dinucleotide biosynthesis protein A
MIAPQDITALILAGGRGARMGGIDKGLQTFNGKPLALHTLQRLQQDGGVGSVMLNANRNLPTYAAFGVPVWPDEQADYPGPLAGFLIGLQHCPTRYLLTVPCDTPLLPPDLARRLAAALEADQADIAMAATTETDRDGQLKLRPQPVCSLLRVGLLGSLQEFTNSGKRQVQAWTAQHKTTLVPFNLPGDHPQAFFNANTLAELHQLERNTA